MNVDYQLKESRRVQLAAVKSERIRESLDSWGAPPDLPSILAFQEHVGSFQCGLHRDYSMFHHGRHLLNTGWSKLWGRSILSLDVDGVLAQSCGAIEAAARRSTTEHYLVGMGCFAG